MKALAVRQPFAELIARGIKTIEHRSWRTHYRGPLVIVSGGTPHADPEMRSLWREQRWPLGVTICLVQLVDVRTWRTSDARAAGLVGWGIGSGEGFAWVLSRPKRLQPVTGKWKLMLFEIDERKVRIT